MEFVKYKNSTAAKKITSPVKTPVGVTYTSQDFCCKSCFFKKCGACYGFFGPCSWIWRKVTAGVDGVSVSDLPRAVARKGVPEIIRLNETGDICIPGTDKISQEILKSYKKAFFVAKTVYGYTHAPATAENIELIKKFNQEQFFIQFSCESLQKVRRVKTAGLSAVLSVESMANPVKVMGSVKLVRCPAATNKNIKCVDCKLCFRPHEQVIVFPVHGAGRKKAIATGKLLKL